jgi:hypothetical protein
MAKATFKKHEDFLPEKLELNLKKKVLKCYI